MKMLKTLTMSAMVAVMSASMGAAMAFDHHGDEKKIKKKVEKKVVKMKDDMKAQMKDMMKDAKCEGELSEEESVMKGEDGEEHKMIIRKCIMKDGDGKMKMDVEMDGDMTHKMKGKHKMVFMSKDGKTHEMMGDMSEEDMKKMMEKHGMEWTDKDGKKMSMMRMHEMHHGKGAESSCKGKVEKEVTVTMDADGNEVTKTVTTCTVKKDK